MDPGRLVVFTNTSKVKNRTVSRLLQEIPTEKNKIKKDCWTLFLAPRTSTKSKNIK